MRVNNYVILILLNVFFIGQYSFADEPNYCDLKKLGWHFYCDKKIKKQEKDSAGFVNPEEQLKAISRELEYKKAAAIMNPTPQNIREYIIFQRQQLDRASIFSDVWQRVIWQNPDLDYTLIRPVNNLSKQDWIDDRNKSTEQTLYKLNKDYGIFFFFRSDCIYCHKYSPILKNFAQKYGFYVAPISMDGGLINEWPDAKIDNGQAHNMGIDGKGVPATILFDKKSQNFIPIAFGFIASSDLEERIYRLTQKRAGEDY